MTCVSTLAGTNLDRVVTNTRVHDRTRDGGGDSRDTIFLTLHSRRSRKRVTSVTFRRRRYATLPRVRHDDHHRVDHPFRLSSYREQPLVP